MIAMPVTLVGKKDPPPWPELLGKDIVHLANGDTIKVAVLEEGMGSGAPSVAFRFDLPGGGSVVAETSAKLVVTMANIIMAKYPELMK